MYKALKRIRVVSSVVYLLLLSWAIVDAGFGITPLGQWLMHVQLVPAIIAGTVVWLVFWILVTLTFGRVYCSTVCPLGTLQDAAGHLGRRFSRGAARHYRYSPPVNALRITIPLVVAACFFVGLNSVVEATDPYDIYRHMLLAVVRPVAVAVSSLAALAVTFLLVVTVAWRRGRLICNTVCPAGALLGFLGRRPVYQVDINTDLCIHCGRCEQVCKSSCIDLRDCVVDTSRCVMCLDCTAVCPNDAITVRRGRHRLSFPLMQRTATSVSTVQSDTVQSNPASANETVS